MRQRCPVDRSPAQPCLQGIQRRLPGGIGEHPVEVGQHVVPGRARGRPGRRQGLAGGEDLLDQHVGATRQPGQVVEVALRVEQAVGVVDAQPLDEAFVEPPPDLAVRLCEHPRLLDAHPGQRGDGEEPAVVELGVAPPPGDQPVVLRGQWVVGVWLLPVLAEHRNHHSAGGTIDGDVPVDVERVGVRRRTAESEHVPPPGVLMRVGHAHVVGHDVDQHTHPEPVRLSGETGKPGSATTRRVHARRVDDVVAVRRAGRRLEERREIDPVDAEVVEVREDARGGVQVEVGGDLQAVGAPWGPHASAVGRLRGPRTAALLRGR